MDADFAGRCASRYADICAFTNNMHVLQRDMPMIVRLLYGGYAGFAGKYAGIWICRLKCQQFLQAGVQADILIST